MLSEKLVSVLGRGGLSYGTSDCEMSTLSMRAPGIQMTTVLDTGSLRVRVVPTLDSVRRNLFGCTDSDENRRFLERELARQSELDSQRWGFDFAKEAPLPGTAFTWQVVPASSVPAALRRAPMMAAPISNAPKQEPSPQHSPETNKTQKRITDFLKPRKRLSANGKKSPGGHSGAHIRPPKVARLAPGHCKRTTS